MYHVINQTSIYRGDVVSNSCFNCTERKLFCHGKCEKYAEYKYKRELVNKKQREFLDGWGYDGCLVSKKRKYY